MPFQVFLSHSYKDQETVAAIHDQLVASGINVWTSEQHPEPGRQLSDKILEAIRHSDALVVLLTETSSVSQYVQQEIGAALLAKKSVLPLATFDVPPDRLGMLAGIEYVRIDPHNPSTGVAVLSGSLQKRRDSKQQQELAIALMIVGLLILMALSAQSD